MPALLSQQLSGVDCQHAAGWDEGGHNAEKQHRESDSGENEGIAGSCVGDEVRHQTAGEDSEE